MPLALVAPGVGASILTSVRLLSSFSKSLIVDWSRCPRCTSLDTPFPTVVAVVASGEQLVNAVVASGKQLVDASDDSACRLVDVACASVPSCGAVGFLEIICQ